MIVGLCFFKGTLRMLDPKRRQNLDLKRRSNSRLNKIKNKELRNLYSLADIISVIK
jgi:hypothetical protein